MRLIVKVLLAIVASIESAKVLFMPSTLYPMHSYTMKHLADELVHRNHQVTWLEYGPVQIWNPNFELPNERTTAWLASVRLCDCLLTRSKAKFDDMVKERFDTVVVDDLYNPCGLLIVALKGSVYIYWSMTALRTESAWANQSPSPPSYLPVHGTKLTEELSFIERTYNLASYLRALYIHQVIILTRIDAVFQPIDETSSSCCQTGDIANDLFYLCDDNAIKGDNLANFPVIDRLLISLRSFQKHYPGVATAFDIERNASINFVNNPPIFDFARPYMPRVNFVGGLHCRNATALGGALNDFVTAASDEDGFVLITTGFTAQWAKAPQRIKDIYLSAFKAYPKVQFIWQYDGTPFNAVPSNVFTQAWLPQQDLLGHPKCRAHITHGGMNSVIESVWHGVPTIGVPLTVAGHDNLLRISARGAGILIPKAESSAEKLIWALREIRKNKYKKEMLSFQDMVRDVPYTELAHAAFWVGFIERHQEVPHARSGADKLNVFQYFLVDVILFLISVLLLIFVALYFITATSYRIIKYILLLVFRRTPSTSEKRFYAKKNN
uniref:glucuronosyltransferase n=1 Tax=Angiostrongylus cantonensis TaxID=6313 RepID=A0A158P8Y4_ANGCA